VGACATADAPAKKNAAVVADTTNNEARLFIKNELLATITAPEAAFQR
jgi:hypothetical protein